MADYKILRGGAILRTADGAFVPADPTNPDYQQYLDDAERGAVVAQPDPEPEPETPPTEILLALLADVTDVDETKPIIEAMLLMLGGQV